MTSEEKVGLLLAAIQDARDDMGYIDTLHAKVVVTSLTTWKAFLKRVESIRLGAVLATPEENRYSTRDDMPLEEQP